MPGRRDLSRRLADRRAEPAPAIARALPLHPHRGSGRRRAGRDWSRYARAGGLASARERCGSCRFRLSAYRIGARPTRSEPSGLTRARQSPVQRRWRSGQCPGGTGEIASAHVRLPDAPAGRRSRFVPEALTALNRLDTDPAKHLETDGPDIGKLVYLHPAGHENRDGLYYGSLCQARINSASHARSRCERCASSSPPRKRASSFMP